MMKNSKNVASWLLGLVFILTACGEMKAKHTLAQENPRPQIQSADFAKITALSDQELVAKAVAEDLGACRIHKMSPTSPCPKAQSTTAFGDSGGAVYLTDKGVYYPSLTATARPPDALCLADLEKSVRSALTDGLCYQVIK